MHLRHAVAEPADPSLAAQYAALLRIVDDPVFHTGAWTYVPIAAAGSGWRLVAWRWAGSGCDDVAGAHRVVIVNFSDTEGWGNVVLPDATGDGGGDAIEVLEMLTNTTYARSAAALRSTGLVVGVAPWSAQIFRY